MRSAVHSDAYYEPRALPPGGRGCHALGALLQRIHRTLRRDRQPFARYQRALAAVAPDLANCQITGLVDGRLELGVPDAPLRAELAGFRKAELLNALQSTKEAADIADLRFRLIPREEP